MAQVATGIVGGAIGFMIGGPTGAMYGAQIGFMVGSYVFAKDQTIKGPSLGDTTKQYSQEGVPRPIVFGNARPIGGNIIYSGKPQIRIKREKVSGGKGGGGDQYTETEEVYRTYALRICEGPVEGVRRIWENNKLVYDSRPEKQTTTQQKNNARFLKHARLYMGHWDQVPDSALQSEFGVNNVPAHRGTCYMVIANRNLTDQRGAIPQYQFEVGTSAGLGFALGYGYHPSFSEASRYEVWAKAGEDFFPQYGFPPLEAGATTVKHVQFSPSNKYLSVSHTKSSGKPGSLIDTGAKKIVASIDLQGVTGSEWVDLMVFSPDGKHVFVDHSTNPDNNNRAPTVFTVPDLQVVKDWDGSELYPVSTAVYSPDGRYLLLGLSPPEPPFEDELGNYIEFEDRDYKNPLAVIDTQTWERVQGVYNAELATVYSVSFSPDGGRLVVGGADFWYHTVPRFLIYDTSDWQWNGEGFSEAGLFNTIYSVDWHPHTDAIIVCQGEGNGNPTTRLMMRGDGENATWVPSDGLGGYSFFEMPDACKLGQWSRDGRWLFLASTSVLGGQEAPLGTPNYKLWHAPPSDLLGSNLEWEDIQFDAGHPYNYVNTVDFNV